MAKRLTVPGHKLTVYTTTVRSAGAHISTGHCTCGWHTEATYQNEVRAAYRNHLNQIANGGGNRKENTDDSHGNDF